MTHKKKFCKDEIIYNIINSCLAGALVITGSIASGDIGIKAIIISIGVAGVIALTKFKDYWDGKKTNFSSCIFNFIN